MRKTSCYSDRKVYNLTFFSKGQWKFLLFKLHKNISGYESWQKVLTKASYFVRHKPHKTTLKCDNETATGQSLTSWPSPGDKCQHAKTFNRSLINFAKENLPLLHRRDQFITRCNKSFTCHVTINHKFRWRSKTISLHRHVRIILIIKIPMTKHLYLKHRTLYEISRPYLMCSTRDFARRPCL